jgi:hypothetical protein
VRRGKPSETLSDLHSEIKRLMYLAYPDSAHSALGQTIAKEAFISELNNCEFGLKVRDRDPSDLEAAFKVAIRVETHLKAYEMDDRRNLKNNDYDDRRARVRKEDFGEPRVRNTGGKNPPAVVDESVRTREELQGQLGAMRLENVEVKKEVDMIG